jgi:hypothetical protein
MEFRAEEILQMMGDIETVSEPRLGSALDGEQL